MGLVINKVRTHIRVSGRAERTENAAVSPTQISEGSRSFADGRRKETGRAPIRMHKLREQASMETLGDEERRSVNNKLTALMTEINCSESLTEADVKYLLKDTFSVGVGSQGGPRASRTTGFSNPRFRDGLSAPPLPPGYFPTSLMKPARTSPTHEKASVRCNSVSNKPQPTIQLRNDSIALPQTAEFERQRRTRRKRDTESNPRTGKRLRVGPSKSAAVRGTVSDWAQYIG